MSEFLVVTDAQGATLDDLVTMHKSLVVSGSKDIKWLVYGAVPDAVKHLQRRWSFRRVRVVATADEFKTSELVVFLNSGDGLYRESLVNVRETFRKNATADLIYGDSAHPTGIKAEPLSFVRRPGWSPERLRAHCYVGETLVVRADLVASAETITDLAVRHPHDRALRLTEVAKNIVRMPELLTMAKSQDTRPSASLTAVAEHCARQKIDATCELDAAVPSVRVKRKLTTEPSVAVIVPTRGTSAEVFGSERVLVVEAVRSLFEKSTYQNFEVVVVADTPTPQSVLDTLREIGGARLKIIDYDRPFNFAEKNNLGAMSCESDLILLLNDDTEIITSDALEIMVAMFNDPTVGVVGPMLLFEDSTIQ
ncbi:MAG: glycosyltransferase, partial [Actinobacteria bacterium]|nr:glycosyltransferase [Actinomycetota bacterium]